MTMTYKEALAFVEDTRKYGSILGLESIRALMEQLGDIQEQLRIIHVAGTNGKGSVCAFLSAALMEHGFLTGRFHSPAVFNAREVFLIGNTMISEEEYASVIERIRLACERLVSMGRPHPTVFEVETAAAFLWFYEKKCDLVLLETGMGGAMDATNLIKSPLCCVLTKISMDHMQFLGDTLSEIACAKAGIIKEGRPVISIRQEPEAERVIREEGGRRNAPCIFADLTVYQEIQSSLEGNVLAHPRYGNVWTHLLGTYQLENLMLALTVLEELERAGFDLQPEKVRSGIRRAVWPGRFEVLWEEPLLVIDGAHNPAAVERLTETIQKNFTNREIIYIIGVLADKDYEGMTGDYLAKAKQVYTLTPPDLRALDAETLAERIGRFTEHVNIAGGVGEALEQAFRTAKKEDVIVVFGSLSYLGEVKRILLERRRAEGTGEQDG